MDTLPPVSGRLEAFRSGDRSMGMRRGRAFGGAAVMAGWEFAMQSRARVGLLILGLAASPWAFAHGPGVTHSYEAGQPVITVRLVPAEAEAAKRVNALDPAPGEEHTNPVEQPAGDAVNAAPANPGVVEGFDAGVPPDESAALPVEGAEAATRYPTAKPVMKPNTETGVGGALDLAPPPEEETSAPRPMRLNAVERPRKVAAQAPRPKQEPRPRPPRPVQPATPDPLDEALPSRVIDVPVSATASAAPAQSAPVNMMNLPPPKLDERIAGGN